MSDRPCNIPCNVINQKHLSDADLRNGLEPDRHFQRVSKGSQTCYIGLSERDPECCRAAGKE